MPLLSMLLLLLCIGWRPAQRLEFSKRSFAIKSFLHYRMMTLVRYRQLQFVQDLCVAFLIETQNC